MLNYVLVAISLILVTSSACADPFSKGDPAIGKSLVEKNCVTCHASSFGGDGSSIYTREDSRIKNAQALMTQIRFCNTMIGSKLFDDEELHVASYLNKTYYKFDQ